MSYPPAADTPTYPARPRPWLWVGAVALALGAGAGGAFALSGRGDGAPAGQSAAPIQQPSAAAPTTPAPAPSASAVTAKPLKVGQTHTFTASDGAKVAVSVLKHQTHEDTYGIQVRTCNRGSSGFIASTRPWLLSYGGGEELSQDSITGGGLLAPEFTEGELEPGGCRKGWLSFVKSGKPDGAEYRIEGETRARWAW